MKNNKQLPVGHAPRKKRTSEDFMLAFIYPWWNKTRPTVLPTQKIK